MDQPFTPQNPTRAVPLSQFLKQSQPKVKEYKPTTLASQNVTQLLDKGGEYVQRAQQRGLSQAARRGLLNSSMAAGAAEAAAIDAVAPLASQDAGNLLQENLQGQSLAWDREKQQIGIGAETALQELRGNQELSQIEKQGILQRALQELQGEQQMSQINRRGELDIDLSTLNNTAELARLREQIGANASLQELRGLQELEQLNRQGDLNINLANINNRAELDQLLQQIAAQADLQTQRGRQEMEQLNRRGDIDTNLAALNNQSESERLASQLQSQRALAELRGQQELEQLNRQGDQNIGLQNLRGQQEAQLAELQRQSQLELQTLRGQQELTIAEQNRLGELERMERAGELDLQRLERAGEIELNQAREIATINAQSEAQRQQRAAELDVWTREQILPLEQQLAGFSADIARDAEQLRTRNQAVLQQSQVAQNNYTNYLTQLNQLYATPGLSKDQIANGKIALEQQFANSMTQTNQVTQELDRYFGGTGTAPTPGGSTPPPDFNSGAGTAPPAQQAPNQERVNQLLAEMSRLQPAANPYRPGPDAIRRREIQAELEALGYGV